MSPDFSLVKLSNLSWRTCQISRGSIRSECVHISKKFMRITKAPIPRSGNLSPVMSPIRKLSFKPIHLVCVTNFSINNMLIKTCPTRHSFPWMCLRCRLLTNFQTINLIWGRKRKKRLWIVISNTLCFIPPQTNRAKLFSRCVNPIPIQIVWRNFPIWN